MNSPYSENTHDLVRQRKTEEGRSTGVEIITTEIKVKWRLKLQEGSKKHFKENRVKAHFAGICML